MVVHKGERHPWYSRTTELASLYRKLVTGDGLDDLLQQFVQRETSEAFNQRKLITQHVITTVVKNLMDVTRKVPRANYQRVLSSNTSKNAELIEEKLKSFWGVKSLDEYVKTRWFELNSMDPNAWCVVEFAPFDNRVERASPYPFEVSSESAVDYNFENNVTTHLTVKGSGQYGEKYTVYMPDETFVMDQLPKEVIDIARLYDMDDMSYRTNPDGAMFFRSGQKYFEVTFAVPHKAGRVPAIRYGYLRDHWTNGFTFASPYHAAVPLLKKSIKTNSEMDLTMALSAFPFRLEYAPACDAPDCYNGHLADGSGVCQVCKGSGHKSVVSAQEKLVLKLPRPGEQMMDLDKLVVFKSPPVDILQFQKDYVDNLTASCKQAMFNSDIFTKQQVSDTATGKRIDLDNVYDTLYDCAIGMSGFWQFLVVTSTIFMDLSKGIRADLIFSKDFKLKGMAELMEDLEVANRSETGPDVKRSIQNDLLRLLYSESPVEYLKATTKDKFNPFSGYSDSQLSLALTEQSVPKRYKIQYLMLGVIFDELEREVAPRNFYLINSDEQTKMVEAKVLQYMNETNERPVLPANMN